MEQVEPPYGDEQPDATDLRMAELLARGARPPVDDRRKLRDEGSAEAEDLLARLDALDYVDAVVGALPADVPERLGEFRILGVLGRGGMGTVYEAWQESLERIVALKVLPPQLAADPQMRSRFRTEARAAATLHHQHIVPVYGYGKSSGLLFFAMERVDGVSLDKHIQHARATSAPVMEPREAARRFAGVADALAHAHRRGILHRDVKPGNILVHPDGALALADFGLSKFLDEHSRSVSRDGGFLGTLHYAAPEQAKGQRASAASDLYALGVTLFECVGGRLPLSGESTEALLESVIHGRPTPLRKVVPKAPRDLEVVLQKLLAKEPGDRYGDGEALARDLMRVADDEPVRIRRQSVVLIALRQIRKHKVLSAALAAAVLLLLTSLFLWQQAAEQERQSRIGRHGNLLVAAVERAESEAGELDGPAGILRSLTGLPRVPAGDPTDVLAMLDEAEAVLPDQPRTEELRAAYANDPLPEATASLLIGHGFAARRLLDEAIAESERRTGFSERDAVTWLRLYRLYMARAVASLTAAVADAESAGKDLLRAAYVRPGAIAPALLSAFVDWSPRQGTDALFSRLDGVLVDAPPGARRVAGGLLRAFAGVRRPEDAHLMPFSLAQSTRRELHRRAEALLGSGPAAALAFTSWAGAVEAELDGYARRAGGAVDDAEVLGAAIGEGRRRLDELVAPGSPLQSWRMVYALIENPAAAVPEVPELGALPPAWQLRAWDAVLSLDLPVAAVRAMRDAFDRTLVASGEADAALRARLEARFSSRVAPPEAALAAAQNWVESASDDPAAYLCRFQAHVRIGDAQWASFDASRALQLALETDIVRRQLVQVLDREIRSGGASDAEWGRLKQMFGGAER